MKRETEGREGSRAWQAENTPAWGLQVSTGQSRREGDKAALAESELRGFIALPSNPSQERAASDAGIKTHASISRCTSPHIRVSYSCALSRL